MRFVKLGLISIVFFCLLLTAISTLLPSTINIVRTMDINAPIQSLHANINDVKNWQKWYANYEPEKTTFSVNTIGNGASIKINNTTITIVQSSFTKVEALWKTGKSRPLAGEINFIRKQSNSIITVQWRFNYKVAWYPWEKFASVFSDKAIGPVMEKSLENLKQIVENI